MSLRCAVLYALIALLGATPACVIPESAFPRSADGTFAAGEEALRLRNLDAAAQSFRRLVSPINPPSVRGLGYVGLAQCALAARNPRDAVRYGRRAEALLEGGDHAARLALILVDAFLELESYELVRVHCERALPYLEVGPDRMKIATLLALLYEREGQLERAHRYEALAGTKRPPEYAAWRERILPEPPPAPTPKAPAVTVGNTSPSFAVPRIVSRVEWGAQATRSNVTRMRGFRRITIHHTGEPEHVVHDGCDECADYLRRLQKNSQTRQRMADIPYHYLIDSKGVIYEGRSLRYQGAHAGNGRANDGNIGIALIGNFETVRPGTPQLAGLKALVRRLAERYGIARHSVYSHRELKALEGLPFTVCPGRFLERVLPGLWDSRGPAG